MAINFYAGIITKVDDVDTVETFIPVNIVKPVPVIGWNEGNAYYYSAYPGELNFMPTKCEVKAFDEEPVELVEVVRILFGIDDSWTQGQYESLFGGNSIVNFFSEQNISTKLNFVLRLNSVAYQSESRIFARFQLGDISRAILFQWEANIGTNTVHNTILALGEEYSETTFENLLNASKLIEETNFTALTYDHFMNYPKYNLFMPMIQKSSDGTYSLLKYRDWQTGMNQFSINLSHWANWYTMLTGKYYYGNPYRFELLNPVNGIQYVDLGVPILPNNQLSEGKVFENTVIYNESIPDEYIGFNYYNVGTDLYYLFSHDGVVGTQTVPLVNGYLQRVVEGRNVIFRLFVKGKGFEFKNCGISQEAKYWDVSFFNVIDGIYSFGAYIMVHKDWATLTVREWLEQIPSDYSQYEYGNNPFFFATYCGGYESDNYSQIKDNDYFDYETYPNSLNPGLVTNFHYINGDREFDMSLCNLEYPIDFEFWETFLTSLIEAPTGPNIGGGSIGGGASGSNGGNGGFDDSGDDIGTGGSIIRDITALGNMFTIYSCSDTAINSLGEWLGTLNQSDITGENKIQSIVALNRLYTPNAIIPDYSTNEEIIVGGYASGVRGNVLSSQFIDFDFGTITVDEYFGSFLDYSPHTSIRLYLPFIGTTEINTDEVMGGTLSLKCTIDILTGTIVYIVTINKNGFESARYSYSGVCSQSIPVSATDYGGKVSSIVSGIATASAALAIGVGTILAPASGGLSVAAGVGVAGGMVGGTYNATVGANKKGNYVYSGNLGSTPGINSVRYPYISIERPKMSLPESYGHTIGHPCNISSNLSSLTGFTVVDEVHLEGFANATQFELDEIETALKQGVLL